MNGSVHYTDGGRRSVADEGNNNNDDDDDELLGVTTRRRFKLSRFANYLCAVHGSSISSKLSGIIKLRWRPAMCKYDL